MTQGIFSVFGNYLRQAFRGGASVLRSAKTVLPYLFGLGEHRREVTEEYPDPVSSKTEDDLPPRTRGLLYNDIDICTGCGDCEKVCPSQCIQIEVEPGPDPTKVWVATYDIDFGSCIFCGICVNACQPGSLIHTKKFEGAVYHLGNLSTRFGRGKISPEQREKWARLRQGDETALRGPN